MANVRSLVTGEHQLIGDIIGASFADDPVNNWVFGGPDPLAAFYGLEAEKIFLRVGYGHVMDDATGGSLWLPPGEKKHLPLWKSLGLAAIMIRSDGFGSIIRGMKVDEGLSKKQPTSPHYYLHAIGAVPQHQGKGIGGKLMEAGLERADDEKMPAYLESSKERNIPFYRRYGFKVVEEFIPTPGCPPLWLMWREPQ